MTARRVLGIDASLTRTGVALGSCERIERCSSVPTGAHEFASRELRIDWILSEVWCFLHPRPDLVVIEDYSYAQGTSAYTLGELGGCLRRELLKSGLPWAVGSPGTIKEFATGNGRASKEQMVAAARRYWPVDNHDEADALHVCRWGSSHYDALVRPV